MPDDTTERPRPGGRPSRAPWHLWVVGVAMFALYAAGAWDYVNLLEPRVAYIESQGWGAEAVAYFSDYPGAVQVLWTLNVAAGLAGPVLLLLRSRYAAPVAATAAGALALLMVITFTFMDRWAALGAFTNLWDVGILVLTLAFWWYCHATRARTGRLRPATPLGRDPSTERGD
ncbi:hypothetical protein J4H86_04420 [Spiractinospora alimapuensis]|uniref:hypothetical protein n=1 Tax=Spiractinospora alimapuensis TaxID=2820884 RepID=UPI001F1F91DB|nr:hypothetical protein [Spiractinospora alimapuensis]QVQ53055.1 hypothetical protein J4H86_04420 [Spiractinospora alimapuensis]